MPGLPGDVTVTDLPPFDGRWCPVCGGELFHWRRCNHALNTLDTFLACWGCRTILGPILSVEYEAKHS